MLLEPDVNHGDERTGFSKEKFATGMSTVAACAEAVKKKPAARKPKRQTKIFNLLSQLIT
jgi:hypothetical protein